MKRFVWWNQARALPTASSRFRLATDALAAPLTLPLAGCVEDFHSPSECALPCAPKMNRTAISCGPVNCFHILYVYVAADSAEDSGLLFTRTTVILWKPSLNEGGRRRSAMLRIAASFTM